MRTYVGELDGFSIYSDSGCPEGTAYIVPGNEILVPEGVLMTDAIIELLRKFKNCFGKVVILNGRKRNKQ